MSEPVRALTSGQMVRESGLSIKALRLYDAKGLLVPAEVDRQTGYRSYALEQVDRARQIALLRRLDVPLARVSEVLDAEPEQARRLLLAWWVERNEGLRAQREAAVELARSFGGVPEQLVADESLARQVRRRTMPEQSVATITSQVTQADLVPAFTADTLTIRQHLAALGVDAEPGHWVIVHEPPVADMSGRIETCVPYSGPAIPTGGIVLRAEVARTEAYLEVPVRDCEFPRIIRYHATLEALPSAAGATREAYSGGWSERPDDIVAEVVVTLG